MYSRRKSVRLDVLAAVLAAAALSAPAAAQEPAQQPPRGETQEPAQEELTSELAAARERLAEAAREVARLSAEATAPAIESLRLRLGPGRRAWLGVNIDNAESGVLVTGVSPNGPAAAAGVATGDLIVALDGMSLAEDERAGDEDGTPSERLVEQMSRVAPGDVVELTLVREGEALVVEVEAQPPEPRLARVWEGFPRESFGEAQRRVLAMRPDAWVADLPETFTAMRPFGRWQGLELVELSPALGSYFGTDEGLLVVRAADDDVLGLIDGDVILEIGSRTPTSPEHAMRILASFEPGETLELVIMRQQQRETLSVELPARQRTR